ncbi:MAG: hypothetical protein U0934_17455, partial [Pseudotabrizicola sp.]|uniref:beta strand repeat-containing protein n=1 Tax=Pseudotabrizicola sp. TaxID=2939647 RepID=UPI00275F3B4E|nr:hypothetical protein [Pseudotabrizicola sp.]MDZ7575712.1 hypothetical protein [Pseudotabrizicola sp.]
MCICSVRAALFYSVVTVFGVFFTAAAQAQVLPAVEMDVSGANTAALAVGLNAQTVTMVNNPNNPNDNIFAGVAPPITATYELFNHQFSGLASPTVGGVGVGFGGEGNPAYGRLNAFGGGANNQVTSLPGNTPGTGIATGTNYGVMLFNWVEGLRGRPAVGRYHMADMRITFSTPVSNPVLNLTGLGGSVGSKGFSAAFDLLPGGGATGLSRLSGTASFGVAGNQVNNLTVNPGASCTTLSSGACGSVHVLGNAVTEITLRIYTRSDSTTVWPTTTSGADAYLVGVSAEVSDMQPSFSNLPTTALIPGQTYTGLTLTCTNNGPNTARGAFCEPTVNVGLISNLSCTPAMPGSVSAVSPNNTTVCTYDYQFPLGATENEIILTGQTGAFNDRNGGDDGAAGNNEVTQILPIAQPAFTLTKSSPTASYAASGNTISYQFVITNTGNVAFPAPPTISDPLIQNAGGSISCPSGPIAIGASRTCTASYTVDQSDLDNRQVQNTATAAITLGDREAAATSNQVTVPVALNLALSIDKRLQAGSPSPYSAVGEQLIYEYVLTNSGNITLLDPISVADDKVSVTCPAGNLAPGASITCTSAAYVIAQSDLDDGSVTNIASASTTAAGGGEAVTSPTDTVTVNANQQPAMTMVKTAPPVDPADFAPGLEVVYSYQITNTGNVTITDPITVSDDRINAGTPFACGPVPLAPTAIITCTASYTVTAADVAAGFVSNIASATDGTTTSNTDTETIPQSGSPGLTLSKVADNVTFSALSDTLTYTFTVTNSGETVLVDLTPITISDPKITGISCSQPAVLNPGESFTCTGSYSPISQAEMDAGEVVNTATASVVLPGGTITSPSSSATVPANVTPALSLEKTGPASFNAVGQVLNFDFRVTNTGPQTLSSISVADPMIVAAGGAVSCPAGSVAPGADVTCTASYTVTQADMDSGQITNTATASGSTNLGVTATDTDDAIVLVAAGAQIRALSLNKSSTPTTFTNVNDEITFAFAVENTGTLTLTNIVVTDPIDASYSCTIASLAPGLTDTSCSLTYFITQADIDAGSLTNTAAADDGAGASDTGGTTLSGPIAAPAIEFDKLASVSQYTAAGNTVTFTFSVRNIGNVTLSDVVVTDTFFSPAYTCNVPDLSPGQVNTACQVNYTVTQADVDSGSFQNAASIVVEDPNGTVVTGEDFVVLTGPNEAPAITVTKTEADGTGGFDNLPTSETFTFEVTNSGNVTLVGLQLSDPMIGLSCTLPDLAPGQSTTQCADSSALSGSYTLTQADVDAGSITNTATATGATTRGTAVTATGDLTLTGPERAPSLAIAKATSFVGPYTTVGEVIPYSYTVTNTGNVTLAGPITVDDDRIADVQCAGVPAGGLAPNATLDCSGNYAITQADLDAGSVTNTAFTETVDQGVPVQSLTDDVTVTAAQTAALALDKRRATGAPSSFTAPGVLISYEFVLRNTGNVTLFAPFTVDDALASVDCTTAPASLSPNATTICTASYTTTQADVDAGGVTNTADAAAQDPDGATVTSAQDSVTVPAIRTPALSISKSADAASLDPLNFLVGNTVTYTYVVENTGNVTLTDPVTVSDNLTPVSCPALPVGGLLPAAQITCTASYELTADDLGLGSTTNNALATSGTTVSPSDDVTIPAGAMPALSIEKSIVSGAPFAELNDPIVYNFRVTNSGNAAFIQDVRVFDNVISPIDGDTLCFDSQGGTVNFPPVAADPLAGVVECQATYFVTQADLDRGFVTNEAYAFTTYQNLSPNPIAVQSPTDTETANAGTDPALTLAKTAAPANGAAAGDTITYTLVATNSGNQTLSNVSIADPMLPTLSCDLPAPVTLAPNAALTCTGSYTVTQSDVDAQEINNTAGATAVSPQGADVSATDTAQHVPQAPAAAILIEKLANPAPGANPAYTATGQTLGYRFRVTNTGNITLSDIVVTDSLDPAYSCPVPDLAPGQSNNACIFSLTTTQADIDAGSILNTATVVAVPQNPGAIQIDDSDDLSRNGPARLPELMLFKSALTASFDAPNQILNYAFEVVNSGNVTITTPVTITDDRIGPFVCGNADPGTLAPGASIICEAIDTTIQADVDEGVVVNTASAVGSFDGAPVMSGNVQESINAVQDPSIALVKTADISGLSSPVAVGDVITYGFTVTNTGNVTLTGITLDDPLVTV